MNKYTLVAATATAAVAMAVSIISPAYAWHPEGKIVKTVQNVTANGTQSDANSSASAVAAKPGDMLRYTITVSNPAKPADKQHNDLAFTVMKDSLPAGVELVDNPSQRHITEELGIIVPGNSVTKHYMVKVTAATEGVIENKACFSGDSIVKDAPRKGCDTANIAVTIPTAPTPAPQVQAAVTEQPQTLPQTGAAGLIAFSGLAAAAGYAGNLLRLRRQG